MEVFFPILVMVCSACSYAWEQPRGTASQGSPLNQSQASTPSASSAQGDKTTSGKISADKEATQNASKAKSIIEQGIEALGGQTYLTIRDREIQGRGYGFHSGRPTGSGGVFWGFAEFPDKERVELTKERDIAELYVGNKAWEITFKGPHAIEQKDLEEYLRRRRFSLETILRTWINDAGVVMLFEGNAIAAQHSAFRVTLINSQNESVTLYFDTESHLPVKKTFEWRDPVDRQKNLEEEVYENYKAVSGVMVPFNLTRYFNGDMANQRFLNSVSINQGLDPAMFDPNSGYNPNKPAKSGKK